MKGLAIRSGASLALLAYAGLCAWLAWPHLRPLAPLVATHHPAVGPYLLEASGLLGQVGGDPFWRAPWLWPALPALAIGIRLLRVLTPTKPATKTEQKEQDKAREEQRSERARRRELKAGGWYRRGGWPLGREVGTGKPLYLPRKSQASHVFVVGGTGSGKTSQCLLPFIFAEAALPPRQRASLLIVDPKAGGELTDYTIGYLRQRGYRVLIYDPLSPGSLRCNVLALYPDSEGVYAAVEQWVAVQGEMHPYWGPITVALIVGVLLYLRTQAPDWRTVSMADAAEWFRAHTPDETAEIIVGYVQGRRAAGAAVDPVIADMAGQVGDLGNSKGTQGSAMSGLRLRLKCLNSAQVSASMRGDDIDWAAFVAAPTVLYLPIDMKLAASIGPVIVSFVSGAVTALDRLAGVGNTTLPRPVRVLWDEFKNTGKVAGMGLVASTARSRDIGLVLATQGPNEIARLYSGKGEGEAIMTNLLTHIVLSGSNEKDLKYYASTAWGLDVATLSAQGTALVRRAGGRPTRVQTRPWYRDRRLRRAVAAGQRAASKASVLRDQAAAQGYTGNTVAAEAPRGWTEGWVGVEAPEATAEGRLDVDPDDDAPLIPALVGGPEAEPGDALVEDWATWFEQQEEE